MVRVDGFYQVDLKARADRIFLVLGARKGCECNSWQARGVVARCAHGLDQLVAILLAITISLINRS